MRNKLLSVAVLAGVLGTLYLPVRFALTFELFGNPVRSSDGWLGPTPRNAGQCTLDIGKVNEWRCADTSVFVKHKTGCGLWLRAFGYAGA